MENETKSSPKRKIVLIAVVVIAAAFIIFRFMNKETVIEVTPLPTVSVGSPEVGDISVDMDNSTAVDSARVTLDSAKLALDSAKEAAALAKTNLDRMQALLNTGDISQQTYESTKNSYDQAQAGVESAELQLEGAKLAYDTQVENSTVTAPVNGVVESTNMSINAMASQSSEVCVISSDESNKLTFSITDRLLSRLSAGTPVKVSKQGETYEGSITRIETLANAQTGLYPVEAEFEGSDQIARGASVKVYFDSESAEDALLVDTDSIYYDGGNPYIYTITYNEDDASSADGQADTEASDTGTEGETMTMMAEGNRAATIHKNAVETGISNSEKTQILSGIDEDSIIVNTWTSQLYEGAQVQVLPSTEG